MGSIAEGVEFTTVAREWRLKWSPENEKSALVVVNKILETHLAQLKSLDGFKSVQRIVCGDCQDFKVLTALSAVKFAQWGAQDYAPEAEFLAAVRAVPGVSLVETQNYTFETM